jgi:hypothetical protein
MFVIILLEMRRNLTTITSVRSLPLSNSRHKVSPLLLLGDLCMLRVMMR